MTISRQSIGSAAFPLDDTIPQISEGTEFSPKHTLHPPPTVIFIYLLLCNDKGTYERSR